MITKRTQRKLILFIITIVVVGAVVWFSHWVMTPSPEKVKKQAAELKAKEIAKTQPQAPATIMVGGIGLKKKTLYTFPPDGCVTIYLKGNWSDYPKGKGQITFSDSTGKVVLTDEPGTYTGSKLPAGNYKICKKDPDAWGVEIWE